MVVVLFAIMLFNVAFNHVRIYGRDQLYRFQSVSVSNVYVSASNSYICRVLGCGARFSQKCNLVDHMRIHTGERPYKCKLKECGKDFTTIGSRNRHMATHGIGKKYKCDFCDLSFTQKCNLVRHKDRKHVFSS